MKHSIILLVFLASFAGFSQNNSTLSQHYEAFYKQMKEQGDVRGVINALTHLNVLSPNEARKDTLAYFYSNSGQHAQAINLLGAEKDTKASNLAVEVKARSLKALNQPQLAVQQFDIMFSRKPDIYIAYDLVDLNLQIGKTVEAATYIKYGLEHSTDEDMLPFYESNPPYQVPLKAAFKYQEGLLKYNEDKENIDASIKLVDEAIVMAPNFKLAKQIRQLLLNQKEAGNAEKAKLTPNTTTPKEN
ncbi:hypothetical protein [Galbibacter orientalis]|uniref:Tetratricopeptide repeat protein n=1 Tax=Galbibacter orientalis DSM 19592 TaxID=926559 RepID=I3C2Y0_9FLAO|nr:hypothetical protein [Galbibacter orientalis]EIJ37973.1 hypothetical protein JoomaDRAFT_0950 [Galbibacter orientalis DSM 19592]